MKNKILKTVLEYVYGALMALSFFALMVLVLAL